MIEYIMEKIFKTETLKRKINALEEKCRQQEMDLKNMAALSVENKNLALKIGELKKEIIYLKPKKRK